MTPAQHSVRAAQLAENARDPAWQFCSCGGEVPDCFQCDGNGGWFWQSMSNADMSRDFNDPQFHSEDELLFLSRSWDVPFPPEPPAFLTAPNSAEDFLPLTRSI